MRVKLWVSAPLCSVQVAAAAVSTSPCLVPQASQPQTVSTAYSRAQHANLDALPLRDTISLSKNKLSVLCSVWLSVTKLYIIQCTYTLLQVH